MPRGKPGTKPPHGNYGRYKNHGCRCDKCRKAWNSYMSDYQHRTGRHRPREEYAAEVKAAADARHGFETSYIRGCRCALCVDAATVARRARRQRNPEASRTYDREYRQRWRARQTAA